MIFEALFLFGKIRFFFYEFTDVVKLLERGLCYGYNRIGVWFIYEIIIL